MHYCRECHDCGSSLDPCEKCDCQAHEAPGMNAYRACAIQMLEEMQDERLIKRAYDLIQYLYIHKEKAAPVLPNRDGKPGQMADH